MPYPKGLISGPPVQCGTSELGDNSEAEWSSWFPVGMNYIVSYKRQPKLMPASRHYKIRRQVWKVNNWGIPDISITATLRKAKSPSNKDSSIIICRHLSSWRPQESQPQLRRLHCTERPQPLSPESHHRHVLSLHPSHAGRSLQRWSRAWPTEPSSCKDCLSPFLGQAPQTSLPAVSTAVPARGFCPLTGGSREERRCFHAPL